MSSPRTSPNDDMSASTHSREGLPLDHTRSHVAPPFTDARNSGTARRIDCQPPQSQFMAAPSSSPTPKSRLSEDVAPARKLLTVGPVHGSLIDDDDDELVDYFSGGGSGAPAPDDIEPLASSPWRVRESTVRTLPSFYPLEKSSVFVPRASASAIAARIATVLRDRSIVAWYDAQNAEADCVSKSRVEFRVRLYRGRGHEFKQGIIVELQRRAGFAMSYFQDVYAILDAAEGKDPKGTI